MKKSVCMIAVIVSGLLAGLMIGTGMDQYTHRLLDAQGWVTEHQVMDALFRRVLPIVWNLSVLLLIISAIISRGSARWLFGAASLLMIVALIVTVRIEVPMNRAIEHWNASNPPSNWAEVRDHWLQFHLVRTISGTIAYLCATLGLTRPTSR